MYLITVKTSHTPLVRHFWTSKVFKLAPLFQFSMQTLAVTTLWTNSLDDKLTIYIYIYIYFFLGGGGGGGGGYGFVCFSENRLWHFMHIVSKHEMSKLVFWKK